MDREQELEVVPGVDEVASVQDLAGLAVAPGLVADPAGDALVAAHAAPIAGAGGREGVEGSHELVGELTRPLVSTNDIEVDGTNLLLDAADGLGVVGRACGEPGLELRDLLFGRLRLP